MGKPSGYCEVVIWHPQGCWRRGTVTRDGILYCWQHDPERPPRRRDANQIGKAIVDSATAEKDEIPAPPSPITQDLTKDPAAVSLGRRGGLKGGPARAASLTDHRRSEIARMAAEARWKRKRENEPSGISG